MTDHLGFYLAGPYAMRDHLRMAAQAIEDARPGWRSTARWLNSTHPISAETINTAPGQGQDYVDTHVAEDLADIQAARVLILVTGEYSRIVHPGIVHAMTTSGGRHVETGYALALGRPIILVGEPENIFHRSTAFHQTYTLGDAAAALPRFAEEVASVG